MFKSLKILKSYYKLASVKPFLIIIEFIFLLIPSVLSVLAPVLAANVISEITVYNYSRAIYFLTIDFLFILISTVSYFCYHMVSTKVNKVIFINLNNYVYENVKLNENLQHLNSSTMSGIFTCAEFNKDFLYKLCFLIKSIILISIILYYNLVIGFAITGVSLVMFLLLNLTDKKIQRKDLEMTDLKTSSVELLNSIKKGVQVEHNYNIDTSLKDKYFKYVDQTVKTNNKISLYYNINNNLITLILKIAVYISTIYLILQVKSTVLTLSLYLILTPYLTNSAQNLVSFFELFTKFGTIDNIMKDFESLKFKSEEKPVKPLDLSTYNIYFYETTLNEKDLPKILSLNIKIRFGEVAMFVGKENCGKRAIYLLLSKEVNTTSGSIFIDNKNIAEIEKEEYKKIVSFTSKEPYFYNMSIFENLTLVCGNKSKINSALKNFGIKELIDKLPEKINTKINEKFNKKLIFFLGLTRAYLSASKIILIYETPDNLSFNERKIFTKIIKFLKRRKSVLLFTHNNEYSQLSDKIYSIENSEIKSQKL